MIRYGLCEPIERVKCVAGVGSRHDPSVVWFVEGLVDHGVMQTPVNPVYQEVGEEDEDRELKVVVEWERSVTKPVVELGIALDLQSEESGGEKRHEWHGCVCLLDLLFDLVLEVLRVVEGGLVKHEHVRQRRTQEIEDDTKEPVLG